MDPHSARPATGPAGQTETGEAGETVPRPQPESRLSYRIESLADFDGYDSFFASQAEDAEDTAQQQQQQQQQPSSQHSSPTIYQHRGQGSFVSLASSVYSNSSSHYDLPTPPSSSRGSSSYFGYDNGHITMSPKSMDGFDPASSPGSPLYRVGSRKFSRLARMRPGSSHFTIPEESSNERESIDMTDLLPNAVPLATVPSRLAKPYAPIADCDLENDDTEQQDDGMQFDRMGYFGPSTSQDEAFIKKLQEQEASGKLTLGIGAGFAPTAKVKESDLLEAAATASPTLGPEGGGGLLRAASLRRAFSRRSAVHSPVLPTLPVSRQDTIKALGQSEANRRGQIVEVILEEEEEAAGGGGGGNQVKSQGGDNMGSKVDLSVVSGPTVSSETTLTDGNRNSRYATDDFVGGRPLLLAAHTLPTRDLKTQIFYPQPNWKPFSMRWPYLLMLILLSAGLGIVQEVIYRQSRRQPLVTFFEPSDIPGGTYFAVKFCPTIIAVVFGVLWQITDFEVKRLEAFYQMSQPNGAAVEDSLNVDYVTYFAFFRPFRALACKHYAVAISSVASLLAVSVVPTLGAAAVILTPSRAERLADPMGEKWVMIDAVWSRLLTATFAVIAALGFALFFLLQSRRTGLQSDVRGIAGLASMAVVSHIMTDFKDMDVATHEDIHHKLRGQRYVLRNSALAPLDDAYGASFKTEYAEEKRSASSRRKGSPLSQNPHPLMLRARGCIALIVGIVLFAALLPIVLFTAANALSENAGWVLTALAVCIKLGWGGLETSVRMMEPYYILSRRHAPAKTLTLDYTAMPFLWVAVQALINRHLLVFFVGFGTVMTELLTVLVTSLATVEGREFVGRGMGGSARASAGGEAGDRGNSSEETVTSFWVTLALVTFILGYMSIVALVAFLRRRRPFLPRQPNTISSVLAYIHQSKMLYSFVATSRLSNAEMLRKLVSMEVTYGLGWFDGRDGQTHCGVDQEELTSSYKVGYDYSRSNQPWIEQPADWL